jgi:hypothetical protein
MAALNVAISAKAMALLNGTLLGDFIQEGVVQPDGSIEITLAANSHGKLVSAAAQNPALGGRLIAIVARLQGQGQGQGNGAR